MAPILYISALSFLSLCLAHMLSTRPSSHSALERLEPKHEPPLVGSASDPTENLPLLDIVLVASVDGKFHALNRTSGHLLWSMSSFSTPSSNMSVPRTLSPLIRTNHHNFDPDYMEEDGTEEMFIIEPQSGDIYVLATPTSPLQLFPFSMSELVDLSPFSLPGENNYKVFVGRKETSLLMIELETGRVKATLDSECTWDPLEELHEHDIIDLDELEGTTPVISSPTEVYVGRTDYHISIYTRPLERKAGTSRVPVQNLSFSTYGPNMQDNHLQAYYRRTKDNVYVQILPSGEVLTFKAKMNEDDSPQNIPQLLWANNFKSPIVAVFDVLRNSTTPGAQSQQPFVLLQPRAQLQDIIPNFIKGRAAPLLPNTHSAFVGIVEETGSLFALSPSLYPLVAFGGKEHNNRDRLIDAATVIPVDFEDEPTGVDEITEVRKRREKIANCELVDCENNRGDRRCLTGSRKVEGGGRESRAKRLLDGPPDKGYPMLLPGQGSQIMESSDINQSHATDVAEQAEMDVAVLAKRENSMWRTIAITLVLGIVSAFFAMVGLRGSETGKRRMSQRPMEVVTQSANLMPTIPPEEIPVIEAAPPVSPPSLSEFFSATDSRPGLGDVDESEREGEGDNNTTPGKRKNRRGRRGRKKKLLPDTHLEVEEERKVPAIPSGGECDGGSDYVRVVSSQSALVFESSPKPIPTPPSSLHVSDTILGFGSHGTVVFQGSFQGRAVAVKRLLRDFVTLASREVSVLQESDDHANVIRYYYQEAHANFLYIALELCPASLADIIETPDRDQWRDIATSLDPKKALNQISSGLRHLHALKLVHRDIKPQNILVTTAKGSGKAGYRMLISDFGLCKKLDVDQTSFLPTAHGSMAAGTVGWRAPEILRGEVKLDEMSDEHSMSSRGSVATIHGNSSASSNSGSSGKPTRLTKSVDIFALGCLFYYTLTSGEHPFGDRFEREVNILKNAKNLESLERFGEEGSEAASLIESMLNPEASLRPDTTTILLHPFFWDAGRRLNFLQDASDRFEIMCREPKDANLIVLEKNAINIVGNDWHSRLDKVFIENLGKFRKYDGHSVQDLLRALRNKKHHYQDLPENVKRHLGPMPEGFLSYFTRRYPRLFLHVHGVIRETGLRSDSMFRMYFDLPDS